MTWGKPQAILSAMQGQVGVGGGMKAKGGGKAAKGWNKAHWGGGGNLHGNGQGKGPANQGAKGGGKGGWGVSPTKNASTSEVCRCCGKTGHAKAECYHLHKECGVCGVTGHLGYMCRHGDGTGQDHKKNHQENQNVAPPAADGEKRNLGFANFVANATTTKS